MVGTLGNRFDIQLVVKDIYSKLLNYYLSDLIGFK